MKNTLIECVRAGGQILLDHFGTNVNVRLKGEPSSVVTDADLASERWIVQCIRKRYPLHSILAEETGYARRDSEFTWVIDPLDGTSNFAAGLPWFGVQIAVLQNDSPILAAMFLPTTGVLYSATKGQGTFRDDQPVQVTREAQLKNVLCAFGLDATTSPTCCRQQADWLTRVSNGVRNIRATNCLFDFCYTLDGRFGGAVNLNTKIWDIAPFALMLPEAGGRLTDLTGTDLAFDLENKPFDRSYSVLGSSSLLHPQLVALLQ